MCVIVFNIRFLGEWIDRVVVGNVVYLEILELFIGGERELS